MVRWGHAAVARDELDVMIRVLGVLLFTACASPVEPPVSLFDRCTPPLYWWGCQELDANGKLIRDEGGCATLAEQPALLARCLGT